MKGDAMNKKWIVGALVALIGLMGTWYAFSPRYTLWQMREAAEDRDADKLSSYVDYPKVRESMKAQLRAAMAAKMMEGGGNGFEAIGMAIGMQMAGPMIDAMISPEMLQAGFAKASSTGSEQGKKPAFQVGSDDDVEIARDGFDTFKVILKDKKGEPSNLIFERRGLGWVLAGVQLPTPKL